jgi:hypothetical protein
MRAFSSIYISDEIEDIDLKNGFISFKDSHIFNADYRILILIKRETFKIEMVSKREYISNHYNERDGYVIAVLNREEIDPFIVKLTKESISEGFGPDLISFFTNRMEKEQS